MSAHVLLNLLTELMKRDQMQCSQSILLLFPNQFNEFNNTGAPMLDSTILKLLVLWNHIFGRENAKILSFLCDVVMAIIT